MIPTEPFTDHLTRLREARNLRKTDIATRAGLDPSSISRLERGERAPELDTVHALSDAMTLSQQERNRLLISAGFTPTTLEGIIDPLAEELNTALASLPTGSDFVLRKAVELLIRGVSA